jgi:hypothetical protein
MIASPLGFSYCLQPSHPIAFLPLSPFPCLFPVPVRIRLFC